MALALAAGLLSLAPPAAEAAVEMSLVTTLPQSHDGEVLVLPDQRVAIAGGADSPVVLYDDTTRQVTAVPGTDGATRFDLDADRQHLTAVSPDPARVYSIGLDDLEVQSWDVPGECPYDATFRGGSFWVVVADSGCEPGIRTQGTLKVLDPLTGDVADATAPQEGLTEGIVAGSVVGLRDDAFVVGGWTVPNWGPTVLSRRFDAAAEGLQQTGTAELTADVHLTEDGTRVYGAETPVSDHAVISVDASTMDDRSSYSGSCGPHTQVTDEYTIGTTYDGLCVQRRTSAVTQEETFTPPGASTPLRGVRLPGGPLVATGITDGVRRLYRNSDMSRSTVALRTWNWGDVTGTGEQHSFKGYVIGEQTEPGDTIEIIDRADPSKVLDRPAVGGDGFWTATVELTDVGQHWLQARLLVGERTIVADYYLDVLEHHRTVQLDDGLSASGGEPVVVTGAAYDNGRPQPGIVVSLRRGVGSSVGDNRTQDLGTTTTDDQGRFRVSHDGAAVDFFIYQARVTGSDGVVRTDESLVEYKRLASTVTVGPIESPVTAGVPFDVPVLLEASDGRPIAGMTVTASSTDDGEVRPSGVTDAEGRATLRIARARTTPDGQQSVVVRSQGDATFADRVGSVSVTVLLSPSTLQVSAPSTARVQEVFTVTGQVDCAVPKVRKVIVGWLNFTGQSYREVATDAQGHFSTTFYFITRAESLPVAVVGDGYCSQATVDVPVSMPKSDATISGSFSSTAPRYVGLRLGGGVSPDGACGPGLELRMDGVTVVPAVRGQCSAFVDYVPTDAVGEVHEFELRYAGDFYTNPASRTWTVTTTAPQPIVHLQAPEHVYASGSFRVLGHLEGAPRVATTVVVRHPQGWERRVDVDRYGDFSFVTSTPTYPTSTLRWSVTYEGVPDQVPSARRTIARVIEAPPLRVSVTRTSNLPDAKATVTVRPTDGGSRRVEVGAIEGSSFIDWDSGTASPDAPLVLERLVPVTSTVRVEVHEGGPWSPSLSYWVERELPVTLALRTSTLDPLRRVDGYAVYARSTDPRVRTTDRTPERGRCVTSEVQRRGADGRWRRVQLRPCDRETSVGAVGFRYTGARVSGARFRVRSTYTADGRFTLSPSAWAYFRFR